MLGFLRPSRLADNFPRRPGRPGCFSNAPRAGLGSRGRVHHHQQGRGRIFFGEKRLDLQRRVIAALEKARQGSSPTAARARDLLASMEEAQRRETETRHQLQETIKRMPAA